MTNRLFAEKNKEFRKACAAVRLNPGPRQASKWRRGNGLAWQKGSGHGK